jgi:hypothetical protein
MGQVAGGEGDPYHRPMSADIPFPPVGGHVGLQLTQAYVGELSGSGHRSGAAPSTEDMKGPAEVPVCLNSTTS